MHVSGQFYNSNTSLELRVFFPSYAQRRSASQAFQGRLLTTTRGSLSSHQLSPMTLSKKANCSDHSDRISDLPCNVMDGILEHLNIQELVRTSILSKKWRYMWISVPRLEFNRDFCRKYDKNHYNPDSRAHRIINKVLLLHNGPIYKFTLLIPLMCFSTITSEHLNKWILFLSCTGIKYLELLHYNYITTSIEIPSHILSFQELTHLKLCGFNLSVPLHFCGFKSLLDLTLEQNTYEFGAFQRLISCCPLLEKLSIELVPDMTSICLKNAKNLIDLRLAVSREMVSGLIKSLPKIQRLAILPYDPPKMLYADIIPPSQLTSLKYLKLDCVNLDERGELLYLVSVLKSTSNLVELVIESNNFDGEGEPDQAEELECNSCCLNQLQTVNIEVGTSFKHAMSLIQFILANSSTLKTLTFNVCNTCQRLDAPLLSSISRDLLQMERASQKADVKFLH